MRLLFLEWFYLRFLFLWVIFFFSIPFKPGFLFSLILNASWETPSCEEPSKFWKGLLVTSLYVCRHACVPFFINHEDITNEKILLSFLFLFKFKNKTYLDVSLVEACFWNRAPWDHVHTCRRYLPSHWPTGMLSFYLVTSTGHK